MLDYLLRNKFEELIVNSSKKCRRKIIIIVTRKANSEVQVIAHRQSA